MDEVEIKNRAEHVRWIRQEATDAQILMLREDRQDMRCELSEAYKRIEELEAREREGWDDNENSMRWGCVLGEKCLMPDPEHFSGECHSVEDMEALYEEWNEP